MTYFDVRIPGLKLTVVAVDGQYVHPVTVEEFRIAVAETIDVLVEPSGQDAFTVFAQDAARTGFVSGTLAVREGLRAPVRVLGLRPRLTMADMGVGTMDHGGMDHGGMDMAGMDHGSSMAWHPASETGNPLVDNQAMSPVSRLDDPGNGLKGNART